MIDLRSAAAAQHFGNGYGSAVCRGDCVGVQSHAGADITADKSWRCKLKLRIAAYMLNVLQQHDLALRLIRRIGAVAGDRDRLPRG